MRRKTALRTNQHAHRLRRLPTGGRRIMRRKNPAQTGRVFKNIGKIAHRFHLRQSGAAALHRARHHNPLPMREFAREAFIGGQCLAARRAQRHNPLRAQLHRLLHHPIHRLALEQRGKQHQIQRRLIADRLARQNAHLRGAAIAGDEFRCIIKTVAVKQHQRRADAQPQHRANMTMRRRIQRHHLAHRQRLRRKQTKLTHKMTELRKPENHDLMRTFYPN